MRKNKIDQFAWQNMSEDEQKSYQETFKQYKAFRSELLKKNKELERSKHDLDFWYKEQKCTKARVGKAYPISIRTLRECSEYYSPAGPDYWDEEVLPTRATMSYAMSLFYKELIKYGEKVHRNLKEEQRNVNRALNDTVHKLADLEKFYNEKYKFMWFPVKVTLDIQFADTHSLRVNEKGETFACLDVNPHNKHWVQVDSLLGTFPVIDMKDCLKIETYPQEDLLKTACTEKYRNELIEYAKLYKEMNNEK